MATQVGNLVGLGEPMAEGSGEDGGVKGFELGGDGEFGLVNARDGSSELIEAIVVPLGEIGGTGDEGGDVTLENVAEEGERFVA